MWFTGIAVVLILGLWFLKNILMKSTGHLDVMEDDLKNIKGQDQQRLQQH